MNIKKNIKNDQLNNYLKYVKIIKKTKLFLLKKNNSRDETVVQLRVWMPHCLCQCYRYLIV